MAAKYCIYIVEESFAEAVAVQKGEKGDFIHLRIIANSYHTKNANNVCRYHDNILFR